MFYDIKWKDNDFLFFLPILYLPHPVKLQIKVYVGIPL